MLSWSHPTVSPDGLNGDRSRAGKRAVTLIQQEHLAALKGREVQVGRAILRFTVICAPRDRMKEALGKGGYSAMRGHGGWCAEVVRPGLVRLGDAVQPVD